MLRLEGKSEKIISDGIPSLPRQFTSLESNRCDVDEDTFMVHLR